VKEEFKGDEAFAPVANNDEEEPSEPNVVAPMSDPEMITSVVLQPKGTFKSPKTPNPLPTAANEAPAPE
jgi:hypothetical protein